MRNIAKVALVRKGARARGAVQIEFVLSIMLLMFVVFWLWELCMATYTYSVLSDAAKEGVRYAIVHGTMNSSCAGPCSSPVSPPTNDCVSSASAVQSVVTDYAAYTFHDVSGLSVCVVYPDGKSDSPSRVLVKVTYAYVPYIALPINTNIYASAQGRIVN